MATNEVQAALATLRKSRPLFSIAHPGWTEQWDAAFATVEQALTNRDALIKEWGKTIDEMNSQCLAAEDKVARLTAELDEARESVKTLVKEDGVVVSRQAAEVARLRDALREIATKGSPDDAAFARAALGEESDV